MCACTYVNCVEIDDIICRRGAGAYSKKEASSDAAAGSDKGGASNEGQVTSEKKETSSIKEKYSLRETDKRLRRKRMAAELESSSGEHYKIIINFISFIKRWRDETPSYKEK